MTGKLLDKEEAKQIALIAAEKGIKEGVNVANYARAFKEKYISAYEALGPMAEDVQKIANMAK
jgi:hypothetical protein